MNEEVVKGTFFLIVGMILSILVSKNSIKNVSFEELAEKVVKSIPEFTDWSDNRDSGWEEDVSDFYIAKILEWYGVDKEDEK